MELCEVFDDGRACRDAAPYRFTPEGGAPLAVCPPHALAVAARMWPQRVVTLKGMR